MIPNACVKTDRPIHGRRPAATTTMMSVRKDEEFCTGVRGGGRGGGFFFPESPANFLKQVAGQTCGSLCSGASTRQSVAYRLPSSEGGGL